MNEQTTVNLPEAPAAATAKVKSPNGFEWLITTRGLTTSEVLDRLPKLEEWLIKHNYTPAENGHKFTSSAAASGTAPNCPEHNTPMKQGKKGWYCPMVVTEVQGRKIYCNHTA